MEGIHTWWKTFSAERFWLGLAKGDGDGVWLAVRCGHRTAPGLHPLIRHVRSGDVVFLFDAERDAIVAWTFARGSVRKRRMVWATPGRGANPQPPWLEAGPSWAVRLEPPRALDGVVSLGLIARLQSELFPALRRLEDVVGEPLHYPFAMGSLHETHLLPGSVFKLPAVFVEACPALA